MPMYRVTLTKTETIVRTAGATVDIPTDDLAKARAYIEIAQGYGEYDNKNPVRYLVWHDGKPTETTAIDIGPAPATQEE